MKELVEWKPQVAKICGQAADGSITIWEFHRLWPEELNASALARSIFQDLEDGVEHFPAQLFSGKPDYETWKASEEYRRIVIDIEILKIDANEARLAEIRNALLNESEVPLTDLPAKVAELRGGARVSPIDPKPVS